MNKIILTIFVLFCSSLSFAENINKDYNKEKLNYEIDEKQQIHDQKENLKVFLSPYFKYYSSKNDYQILGTSVLATKGNSIIMLDYKNYRNLNKSYGDLSSARIGYNYKNSYYSAGIFTGSSSDVLFGSKEVIDYSGYLAYNLMNILKDPEDYENNFSFYLGALISKHGPFNTKIFPYISLNYKKENFMVALGFPFASMGYKTSDNVHSFEVIGYLDGFQKISYAYSPTPHVSISTSIEQEKNEFLIQKDALKLKNDSPTLQYEINWLRFHVSYIKKFIKVEAGYGYMLNGYSAYSNNNLKKSKSTRLPHTNELSLTFGLTF